jgi:hypothetical protein
MKKCTVLALVAAATVAFAPVVLGQVAGEKIDSGLGSLTASDVRAYMHPNYVAGEKVDSGLGQLTAADIAPYMGVNVAGEKIDSGLGELTAADIAPYMDPNHVAGEKIDSGLGDITAQRSNSALIRAAY